jgi:FGGY-family pentulose kinase
MASLPEKHLFLGIDVGTQSVRVGLFDPNGDLVSKASVPYATYYPAPGLAEQDPWQWWRGTCLAIKECIGSTGIDSGRVAGISFDATSSTVLLADREGEPLDRAILWMDQRSVQETKDIQDSCHPILRYVGGQDSVEWMVPKALWLKRNRPDLFNQASLVIEATDWLAFRLTGAWTASRCNATCKWNYVSREGGWDRSFFTSVGLEELPGKWPENVMPLGEQIGVLTRAAADELGLPAGIPVGEGGVDAHVGLLGLNALSADVMGLILGSSNVAFVLNDRPVFSESFWGPYPDAILEGTWLIEAGQTSSGAIINWLVENIARISGKGSDGKLEVLQSLENEVLSIAPGSEGLVTLDYWQGNRTPRRDPQAKGIVFGLTLGHDFRHLYRSIYEGIVFGTRHIVDTLRENSISVDRINAGGGGIRSRFWLQLTADLCKLPISVPKYADSSGVLGSAICASCASGFYSSLTEAAERMVSEEKRILPQSIPSELEEAYRLYLALYETTKTLLG